MPLTPGSRFGPYTIAAALGSGGMGEVFRAHDPRLDREVALKVMRATREDAEALDRLLAEATLASSLNHPNIVTIYETGVIEPHRYVAMELVQGTTLRALAIQGVTMDRALEIVRQTAEALAVAHAAQIVHRDIKPENIMVRPDGYVKVLDFGLARLERVMAASPTMPGSAPGVVVGTVAYMAPEQARGEGTTAATDVFALGVVMYELLTGTHPFTGPTQAATIQALLFDTPEPPAHLNPDLPRAIDQVVVEALNKDPRLRPGAEEIMFRLAIAKHATEAAMLSPVTVTVRATAPPPPDIVGRDEELKTLTRDLDRVLRGGGRMVLVSAEAGMGKTTIVESFLRQVESGAEPIRVGRGRCSERLAGSEAYLPVLEVLESLQHNEQLGNLGRVMRAVAPSWYAQIIPAAPNDSSAARLAAETTHGSTERLKRELLAFLDEASRIHPVVICVDDLHWADPSTTDLIGYLAQRLSGMRVLLLGTARPSVLAQTRHPMLPLKLDLVSRGLCRELMPDLLDVSAVERYVAVRFPQHVFPDGFASVIHKRTEGHPLFMVDLLRDLKRRRILREVDGRFALAEDLATLESELPESVRSLLQRKMDALDDVDRRLLGAASVQGVDFDTAVLATALRQDDEDVEIRLERLEREHALVRFVEEWEYPDRTLTLRYRFAHQIYQNGFYSALRVTRRAAFSRAIADCLVSRLGSRAAERAPELAVLCETARDSLRAAEYFNLAAQHASRLYAHDESARVARHGLDLLEHEPAGPARDAVELGLQMTFALAVKTGRGYAVPEVGRAYERARELCRRIDDPARVVPVLIGMSAHHLVAGEITTSRDVAVEMLQLFGRLGDRNLLMVGEWSLGAALFHLAELEASHAHLSRALELYDPAFHASRIWETGIEPGIFATCELSRTLTLRGFPDQAVACIHRAVSSARALDHPQPLAFALLFEIFVHLARRAPSEVLRTFEELRRVCERHGIAQELQWSAPLRGRALIELGDTRRGLQALEEGLAAHTLTRSALLRPYYFVLLAGGLLRCGRLTDAQRALNEGHEVATATGQHAYDSEHFRIEGVLRALDGNDAVAAETFARALEIAASQGARWLELRTARAYADFLVSHSQRDEARAILKPVFDWFTEGFETPEYVYADALLRSLD
jgi:tetratricopeptide (TPR) repeat protein